MRVRAFFAFALVCFSGAAVLAADLPSLSWGEFTRTDDDPAKAEMSPKADRQRLDVTMKLTGFEANADGDKLEGSANFIGQFLVSQPKKVELDQVRAKVAGLIVKTAGTTARIDITIGGATQSIEWAASDVKAERFETEIMGELPNGRITAPFPVSAIALVKREAGAGSVLVTVDTITIEVSKPLVSDLPSFKAPAQNAEQPAEAEPAPAVVAIR
jgi:hypothetical protein